MIGTTTLRTNRGDDTDDILSVFTSVAIATLLLVSSF